MAAPYHPFCWPTVRRSETLDFTMLLLVVALVLGLIIVDLRDLRSRSGAQTPRSLDY